MERCVNIVLNNFTNDARVHKTSVALRKLGFSVEVVALHESGLNEEESGDGFRINRIKLSSKKLPKIPIIQLIKYVEFVVRVFIKHRNQVDFVHCNDLGALPIGFLLKTLSRGDVKVVYDCHEYETERDGMSSFLKKVLKFFERRLIGCADSVLTVSDSIASCYADDYSIAKPKLVLNCPRFIDQGRKNLFRKIFGIRADQKIFLYQGGLKGGRGIELILEAFSDLESDENVLVCMGYGPLEGAIREKASDYNTIFFHPAVSQDVLLNYTSSADYGILFYEDTCLNHRYCSPNKIFEYLMAGLPVLTSNLYEVRRLVESEGVGIVAHENTVASFRAAVIDSLKQDYSAIQANVFSARKRYCWEEQEKVLKEVYDNI
ncbi:glycosyltransferase involved in cell wall biosynthesis [Marinobacter sp. 3-2]|uniref:glycosyltransferase n=1 Tax=Marinobacter sp. 3-2 TaxID=2485141 RepID=UPI000DD28B40|nr:glycosyltransferase [Marinobacter sp. 3-2]ROQ47067.1 glycosyltransferase involved in cell wall biosynthesis [Marinobacter sp. 3-2]